ncbi:transcription factor [Ganoderma sinense ZZ0214-1]|uniref:Transcription factor n=1 Tax=Ganoderma sinense ZZ0214-1 TaxID=1077348 RepID=A0A2G8SKC1_9APHY|nr:transcription factor [Ganoderma sinense ZZ0214-1]
MSPSADDSSAKDDLFLDPLMGTPLAIYVEKDVDNWNEIVKLITTHGGIVSQGYSGVAYILVDPHKESGQSLYRQYVGKKGKIVLNAQWVIRCVEAGELQTYHTNFGDCKVTGTEKVIPLVHQQPQPEAGPSLSHVPQPPHEEMVHHVPPEQVLQQHQQQQQQQQQQPPPQHHTTHPQAPPAHGQGIPPPPMPMGYAEEQQQWDGTYHAMQPPPPGMVPPPPPEYAYRYRDDQGPGWVPGPDGYYTQHYEQPYPEAPDQYMEEAGPSNADAEMPVAEPEKVTRGRKRTKLQPQPAAHASTLVANRRNPPGRSPTPPTRVIKSTYGGNLFTSDDILYLKRYIDYCQEQGLVLSLREICERIAIKAPHHTFYSWRRYCNKHKIRLGGYAMDLGEEVEERDPSSMPVENEAGPSDQSQPMGEQEMPSLPVSHGPGAIPAAHRAAAQDIGRTRSPTPPRALYRSTTGKGVAFTDDDVIFLVRFLEYRTRQHENKLDMVQFWKEVALKAPHHSRASWMKFYRRHKHELHHEPGDEPIPAPPEKKMRYSRKDDILLAQYFFSKPEGTSDKIFQAFGRQYPHHPWKGWQEHHRIHKVKIDHLIQRLGMGENIDDDAEQ